MSAGNRRLAIVTGAGRGIGAAVAAALADAGWRLAGVDRTWPSEAGRCDIRETVDVTGYDSVSAFIEPRSGSSATAEEDIR